MSAQRISHNLLVSYNNNKRANFSPAKTPLLFNSINIIYIFRRSACIYHIILAFCFIIFIFVIIANIISKFLVL
jgi:hypothetical protein